MSAVATKAAVGTPAKKGVGSAAGKKAPPKAPAPGTFIAATKFDGAKPGMAFKNGPHGLGYYLDASGSASPSQRTADTTSSSNREQLDPAEVFSTLPLSMQVAFEARDIMALDAALAAMPPAEAEECMRNNASSPSAKDEDRSAAASSEGVASSELFERGPYRAGGGGPKSDLSKGAKGAAAEGDGKPSPAAAKKAPAAAKPMGKGSAAKGSSSSNAAESSTLSERVEALTAQLRQEQQARGAMQAELEKAHTATQRLLEKLDAAERFKSDEAKAVSASRKAEQRLQAENEVLRKRLAAAGLPTEVDGLGVAESSGAGGSSSEGAMRASSAFDAAKQSPDQIPTLGFPPASLDPDEVLATLPESMQRAFDALDVQALHAALAALPPAEASEYMRRCVASGLWDPNGGGGEA
ncbi:hypothetical protein Ctob_014283 [Chrysochromulina tobinii]|uniref:Cdc37 C-terminal domain-containing protein n=1 Tax=Chrysochromulina tobinii TaxID=1460289 RepID=A0A0M0JPJ8_9EUKA|nr:hypothetical protein Ctob_014283 [Chrysochromulina tobinii]|eukprot:KOO28222.1 hypothetical protein Ctob_014283 [Chrysochromulina sp. CCMP291]